LFDVYLVYVITRAICIYGFNIHYKLYRFEYGQTLFYMNAIFFYTYSHLFIIYCLLLLQTSNSYKNSFEFNFVFYQFDTFYLDYSSKEIITSTGTYFFSTYLLNKILKI